MNICYNAGICVSAGYCVGVTASLCSCCSLARVVRANDFCIGNLARQVQVGGGVCRWGVDVVRCGLGHCVVGCASVVQRCVGHCRTADAGDCDKYNGDKIYQYVFCH